MFRVPILFRTFIYVVMNRVIRKFRAYFWLFNCVFCKTVIFISITQLNMDNTTSIHFFSVSTIIVKIKYGRFVDFMYRI